MDRRADGGTNIAHDIVNGNGYGTLGGGGTRARDHAVNGRERVAVS